MNQTSMITSSWGRGWVNGVEPIVLGGQESWHALKIDVVGGGAAPPTYTVDHTHP